MYQPPQFREDDLAAQHALIRAHPLGLLITAGEDGPLANPVPFELLDDGGKGLIACHVARANPQWTSLRDGATALVVFRGPDSYVTPSWYASKRETGKVVPTWNYAMVQVRGTARIVEDRDWLRAQVGRLTALHERQRAAPWAVEDAPEPFIEAQLRGIVGIEIAIADIHGKWKVSQNRPAADIAGVHAGLTDPHDPHADAEMATMVGQRRRPG